jgi:hypothetical protein
MEALRGDKSALLSAGRPWVASRKRSKVNWFPASMSTCSSGESCRGKASSRGGGREESEGPVGPEQAEAARNNEERRKRRMVSSERPGDHLEGLA